MDIIDEQSSYFLDLAFTDDAGAPVTPSSGSYRIDDADGGTTVLASTPLTISGPTLTLAITPAQNAIINQARAIETRRVFIIWVYGGGKQGAKDYLYQLKNCSGVAR